jgi:hypothetical protein
MSRITAGLGLGTSRGDGRRITTGAGFRMAERGPGGLDRSMEAASTVHSGRPRMFPSLDGARASGLDLASEDGVVSAGFRLARATGSIRGGADMAGASGWSVSVADSIALAALHLCMVETDSRILATCIMLKLAARCRP